jgi:hypothetical protein
MMRCSLRVKVTERKLNWGNALMRIRRNRAELLAACVNQAMEIAKQARRERDAEMTGRVQIFGALTNLAP